MESKSDWSEIKCENVIRLISFAMRDRGAAYSVFHDGYLENTVYNLHQASEKMLKAFLIANDLEIEKTHSINALLVSAGQVDPSILSLQKVGIGSTNMTRFAIRYRYPNWDKNDFSGVEEVLRASEFSDALYDHLQPFFGNQILEKATQYARVPWNPFKRNLDHTKDDDQPSCASVSRPTNKP